MESETRRITDQILTAARRDAESIVEVRKAAEVMLEMQREEGCRKVA
jgi:hypothetical protein